MLHGDVSHQGFACWERGPAVRAGPRDDFTGHETAMLESNVRSQQSARLEGGRTVRTGPRDALAALHPKGLRRGRFLRSLCTLSPASDRVEPDGGRSRPAVGPWRQCIALGPLSAPGMLHHALLDDKALKRNPAADLARRRRRPGTGTSRSPSESRNCPVSTKKPDPPADYLTGGWVGLEPSSEWIAAGACGAGPCVHDGNDAAFARP
jgi:hypothetical protein